MCTCSGKAPGGKKKNSCVHEIILESLVGALSQRTSLYISTNNSILHENLLEMVSDGTMRCLP